MAEWIVPFLGVGPVSIFSMNVGVAGLRAGILESLVRCTCTDVVQKIRSHRQYFSLVAVQVTVRGTGKPYSAQSRCTAVFWSSSRSSIHFPFCLSIFLPSLSSFPTWLPHGAEPHLSHSHGGSHVQWSARTCHGAA